MNLPGTMTLAMVIALAVPPSSTFLSGGSYERAADIAVDSSGRAFLAINTQSRDYGQPRRLAPADAWLPRTQAFVTRLDVDGTLAHWPVTEATLQAITVDAAGNIYVVGSRQVSGFTIDAFLAKLRPSGSVEYSVTFGGAADDLGRSVAVDSAGNIFIAGITSSPDFQASTPEQPCQASPAKGSDAFLVRIDPRGVIAESTCLGGSSLDYAYGVELDPKGDLIVAGLTRSTDFPVTADALQRRFADIPCEPRSGCGDVFVAKVSAAELRLRWATYLGGSRAEGPEGFAVDAAGDIYVTGFTMSRDLPLHDALQPECHTAYTASDCGDGFVMKLSGSGSALLFGSFIGGSQWESATAVAIAPSGLIYVSGTTASTNLLDRQFETPRPRDTDGFLLVLDGANDVRDVRVIDQGANERMEGVAADTRGNVYLIGGADISFSGTPCCYTDRDAYVITTR